MKISIEKLVELIVEEVVRALVKEGVEIDLPGSGNGNLSQSFSPDKTQLEIDMSGYKTPVLTENHLSSINDGIREVIVPEGTVVTPGARIVIKTKQLVVTHSNKNKGE